MKVKFYPRSENIPCEVCDHRNGAVMTFSSQTDARYQSSIYAGELYAFKNNIRIGAFVTNLLSGQYNTDLTITENTGVIRHDVYFATDMWQNPTTGVIERIPDHFDTVWSSAGEAFFNVTAGDPKSTRFPAHGQQMYDLSGGALGYDVATDTIGTSQLSEYIGVVDSHSAFWLTTFNRDLSAGSYRNGVQGSKDISLPYYLGNRNSESSQSGDADTYYGDSLGYNGTALTGRDYFKSYPLSTRWLNAFRNFGDTQAEATTYLQGELAKTILNGGWFRDFAHYHDYRNSGYMEKLDEFFQACNVAFGTNNVHTCSNGEALEYMYLRDATNRVVAKDDGTDVYIVVDFDTNVDFPLYQINTPLSIEIDLSGTSLSGKQINSTDGKVIDLGNDIVIVPVIFRKGLNIQTVKLFESTAGYVNTNKPQITSSINGSVLTINTDQPTKMVIYEVDANGFEYDALPVSRVNEFRVSNNYTMQANKDYYIGVINEFGSMNYESI